MGRCVGLARLIPDAEGEVPVVPNEKGRVDEARAAALPYALEVDPDTRREELTGGEVPF